MRVFLCIPMNDANGERLEKKINEVIPHETIETYNSLTSLAKRLQDSLDDYSLVILMAANYAELLEMRSLRNLLLNQQTFLVLPDQEVETIRIAHSFRPRFLTVRDSDFSALTGILERKLADYARRVHNSN